VYGAQALFWISALVMASGWALCNLLEVVLMLRGAVKRWLMRGYVQVLEEDSGNEPHSPYGAEAQA
jgi:hypothetical protein